MGSALSRCHPRGGKSPIIARVVKADALAAYVVGNYGLRRSVERVSITFGVDVGEIDALNVALMKNAIHFEHGDVFFQRRLHLRAVLVR